MDCLLSASIQSSQNGFVRGCDVGPSSTACSHLHHDTDASNRAVGAVLAQFINGQWKLISFFSKKLSPAELKYSAFNHELLAAYLAVRHFQYFVEGRVFHINTDHKPLTFALHSCAARHSPRQARHLAFISEFTTDIRHIEGEANRVADALSHNNLALEQSLLNLDALASAQDQDEELLKLSTSPTSLQVVQVPLLHSGRTLLCDISQGPMIEDPSSFVSRLRSSM